MSKMFGLFLQQHKQCQVRKINPKRNACVSLMKKFLRLQI